MTFARIELPGALVVVPDITVDVADPNARTAVAGLVGASQVAVMTAEHGTRVREVDADGVCDPADSLWTSRDDLAVAALAADCVPIAWVGPSWVGVTHAGWRGVLAGAHQIAATRLAPTHAVIGPSICAQCYEVSHELVTQFESAVPHAVHDERHLDLAEAVEHDLRDIGIEVTRVSGCTKQESRLRSYRGGDLTARGGIVVVRA